MEYRTLGRTGLKVSDISLGTVELGMEYGIKKPGQSNLPSRKDAIRLIQYAAGQGINLFDTAPGYGVSEELLGEAIGDKQNCYFATKITVPQDDSIVANYEAFYDHINKSIEKSLRSLRRDVLDIVQVHNATVKDIKQSPIVEVLQAFQKNGKIRVLGASVYGEENALVVQRSGYFDAVQLAYNILDQRLATYVFSEMEKSKMGIINRSVLLKGALSHRAKWLPEELRGLTIASEKIVKTCNISWEELPQLAIRFCLSSDYIHTVLIGAVDPDELDMAIEAAALGGISDDTVANLKKLAIVDEQLLNPVFWPVI